MTTLVIGGGFLGVAIANLLHDGGKAVRVLSPHPDARLRQGVQFRHGRLEMGADIDELLLGCSAVVDAASSAVPATVQASPSAFFASGVANSSWLAERAVATKVRSLIYLSSGGTVYSGDLGGGDGFCETDLPSPVSAYGGLKYASEVAIHSITRGTDTRAASVRIANAYGPGQNLARPQGIIGIAWRNAMAGVDTVIYGGDEVVRDYVHSTDIATLCALLIESEFDGAVNCGSGQGTRLNELLTTMEYVSGRSIPTIHAPRRRYDAVRSVLDISLARSLGWRPEVGLPDGLKQTWQWLQSESGRA